MYITRDHPEVARAIETGYPEYISGIVCVDCGNEYYGDEKMYEFDGEYVCSDCTRDRLLDAFGTADLAAAFNVSGATVSKLMEAY